MLNSKTDVKHRESNIELFRIIIMFLIVAHHYIVNSGIYEQITELNGNAVFALLFGAWGKTGINCFVFITGYFMCKSNITLKKFLKLFFEFMFYKISISFAFIFTGYSSISLKSFFLDTIVPFREVSNNFVSCYLLFFLFIPFLNILLTNLSEKQHLILVLLCMFVYSFFGTVPYFSININYISWFIVLYLISSYIRLYPRALFQKTMLWGILSVLSFILSILSIIVCQAIGWRSFTFVSDSNTVLAVTNGLFIFLTFKNIKIKYHPIINMVASTTFGVLLIHANSDTMRQWLWKDLLHNADMYYSELFLVHAILSVVGVFMICSIIDYIRIVLIEKPIFKLIDKPLSNVQSWTRCKIDTICNKFNISN